jgi:hypothetical protein
MPLSQISDGMVPRQTPATQLSLMVHEFPSLHRPETGACMQPPSPSQVSAVQLLPSSQEYGVPAHTPPEHESLNVHALPSLHRPLIGMKLQPPRPSQLSAVQTFLSSHE